MFAPWITRNTCFFFGSSGNLWEAQAVVGSGYMDMMTNVWTGEAHYPGEAQAVVRGGYMDMMLNVWAVEATPRGNGSRPCHCPTPPLLSISLDNLALIEPKDLTGFGGKLTTYQFFELFSCKVKYNDVAIFLFLKLNKQQC